MPVEVQPQVVPPSAPIYRDILPTSIELGGALAELVPEFPGYTLGIVTGAILHAARTASAGEPRSSILERARTRLRE